MEFHLGAEGGQENLGLACLNTGKMCGKRES